MNRIPSFFVVGAAKSGTTALWNYFQQHPAIFVTKEIANKELGYFSNQYGVSDKNYYSSFFKDANDNQLIGEVCHAYLTSLESAEWIRKEVPQAKIIILLRDPINRAYSLYNWMIMHGYENKYNFRDAIDAEDTRFASKNGLLHTFHENYLYFSSGLYYEQVKRYFDVFGKENVLVIAYEEFYENQLEKLNEVYNFLGVEKVKKLAEESINKSKSVFSVQLQFLCRKFILKFPKKRKFRNMLLRIMEMNNTNKKPAKINIKLRKYLEYKYSENIKLLSKLCEYDFKSIW